MDLYPWALSIILTGLSTAAWGYSLLWWSATV